MKQLKLVNVFYALPLVFFVLTGSPNLNGESLGLTLGCTVLLFLIVGYLNFRKPVQQGKLAKDVLATTLIILIAYLGSRSNVAFALMLLLWPALHFFRPDGKRNKLILRLIQGSVLFCLIYFGINRYGFDNLSNARVFWLGLVFVLQYLFFATQFGWRKAFSMKREIGLSYVTAIIGLALYAWLQFDSKYLLYLFIACVPALFILFRLVGVEGKENQITNVRNFRILAIAGLTIFNFYLFIDATQVLQAVMAGY